MKKPVRKADAMGKDRAALIKAKDKAGYIGQPAILSLAKESKVLKKSGARMAKAQEMQKANRAKLKK